MFNVNFVCLVIGDPQGDGRGDGDEGVDSLWWRDTKNIPERGEWSWTDVTPWRSVRFTQPVICPKQKSGNQ